MLFLDCLIKTAAECDNDKCIPRCENNQDCQNIKFGEFCAKRKCIPYNCKTDSDCGLENKCIPINGYLDERGGTKTFRFIFCFLYTKSLVNINSFYTNFTNTHFQKDPIPHLTRTMKQKFLH